MKKYLALLALLMVWPFSVGCGNPVEEPKPPQALYAEAQFLLDGILTTHLSWIAQDPYTMHSVYYGTGDRENPSGEWEVDPIGIDSIMRADSTEGTHRKLEMMIEVPLVADSISCYVCVVSWNKNLHVESCIEM